MMETTDSSKKFDVWAENDYHKIKEHLGELDSCFMDIEQSLIEFLSAKSVRTKEPPSVAARKFSIKADGLIKELRMRVNRQRQDFLADYS